MRTAQIPPAAFQVAFLAGNLAFLGSWVLALSQPRGWQWLGPALVGLFLLLRVGGMWLLTLRAGSEDPQARKRAVLYTLVALAAAGFWVVTVMRGVPVEG